MPVFSSRVLPMNWSGCWNQPMLTGKQLGQALRSAMAAKRVSQGDVAKEFGIRQPSVSEWCRYGRIGKRHLPHLVEWFSDVVGAEHWGMPSQWSSKTFSRAAANLARQFDALPATLAGGMTKRRLYVLLEATMRNAAGHQEPHTGQTASPKPADAPRKTPAIHRSSTRANTTS